MSHWIVAPPTLALLAALGHGSALVAMRFGLRHMTPAAGVLVGMPTSAVAFWTAALVAPGLVPPRPWPLAALAIFAAVGVFFPALVSLLVYAANARMGPTVTGTVSSLTPVFAALGAMLLLGEVPRALAWAGIATVALGVAALTWRPRRARFARAGSGADHSAPPWPLVALAFPLCAAVLRGVAQPSIKAGLALLPSPFLGGLVSYSVSASVVWLALGWRWGGATRFDYRGLPGFMVAGLASGAAVLLTYFALQTGAVAVVAPIIATAPLFTLALSAVLLREELLHALLPVGVALTVAGVALILSAPA